MKYGKIVFHFIPYHALVSGAGALRFKSRVGQIKRSVANGWPPLRHFLEMSCVARAQWHGDGPRKLVTRFGVLQQVKWKNWFWFDFWIFLFSFWAKIFNKYEEITYPPYTVLGYSALSQREFSKKRDLQLLDWSQDVAGKINTKYYYSVSRFFWKFKLKKQTFCFQKFWEEYPLVLV